MATFVCGKLFSACLICFISAILDTYRLNSADVSLSSKQTNIETNVTVKPKDLKRGMQVEPKDVRLD